MARPGGVATVPAGWRLVVTCLGALGPVPYKPSPIPPDLSVVRVKTIESPVRVPVCLRRSRRSLLCCKRNEEKEAENHECDLLHKPSIGLTCIIFLAPLPG